MRVDGYRILLVADNALTNAGGEAARPIEYFSRLWRRGLDVHLVVHARCRTALESEFPDALDRIHFVPDSRMQRMLHWMSGWMSDRLYMIGPQALSHLITQQRSKPVLRAFLAEGCPTVIHQPYPISIDLPSLIYGLGCPVIIGPLNGGMRFPPAFRRSESWFARVGLSLSRMLAGPLNRVLRGKIEADVLLYSNERTRERLPDGHRGETVHLVANAVDTKRWKSIEEHSSDEPPRFVTSGRLVDFKAIDRLLDAFAEVRVCLDSKLAIIGDGPLRSLLEGKARDLGIQNEVRFLGWLGEQELISEMAAGDVFVFPSLREAGGAAVLEAMALGLPVIAARWGGPVDYVAEGTGLLVDCSSRDAFTKGLVEAMLDLGSSRERRQRMGRSGRLEVEARYDWEQRIDFLEALYRSVLQRRDRVK